MSTRSQLTKDLNESVKALLGKRVKILLKNVVRLETKGDKTENRVLVFSPCRLFLLTAKVPTRIDYHFHYLEIQAIESKRNNQLTLTVGDKIWSFLTNEDPGSSEVDAMVQALATAIRNIFPTVPLTHIIRKVEVVPAKRIAHLRESEFTRASEVRGLGPCNGFSTQYACMCDYHTMPYREEVAWDVDTIYLSHDTRELCLRDFDHLDPKDLVPIISALEYNTWFTKLRASNTKLTHDALERIIHIMKKNLTIEELYLDNLGVKWEFAHKLSLALISNNNTPLHTLDLSSNMIEDKGANSLCGIVAKLCQGACHLSTPLSKASKGLVHLNVSHCGLTSKGVNQLAHALSLNKLMPNTLTYLNLSGNNLKEDVNNLCNFLAQPNQITHLDISGTDCTLETIFGALLRGCATNLVHLNVSKNAFSTKKAKEVPPSFKQFFTSTLSLKYLNMSYCKLPLEALKNLLLGLACNESTTDIALDMSCNNLGSQGAHVLESCIHGVRSIGSLDITENNMDVDLAAVVVAVSKNKSIKHLHMGRNMANMKAKHISAIMDALVTMIQEEDCVLQTLAIPDSRLKSDLYNLINALGSNQCLQTIDFSGNLMGDAGARLLAKALQINSKIRSIMYDRNNITLQGYNDLAYALESNYTVRYMPMPLYDLLPCMKVSAEKTDAVMKKIQDVLHRNVSPKKYSNGQAFRLQQGFLLSSTQQMVDRLVLQTQETIRTVAQQSTDKNNDINLATNLIQDADNCKQLLPRLHEVVQRWEEAGNPIDIKLKQISDELHSVITNYLQDGLECMMKCAEQQCSTVLSSERVQTEIRNTCREKNFLDPTFTQNAVMELAGTHVMNKINELNLAVAAHVSDRITDEVIESLSKCHKSLLGDVTKKRSSTPDVLRTMSRISSDSSRNDPCESLGMSDASQQSDPSPMATPHLSTKRKSLHGRKLRPKSVVDNIDGMSADDIPDLLPSLPTSAEESLDSVCELGPPAAPLQHLVKGRPRRAKTRAPSRPTLRPPTPLLEDSTVDTFFSLTPTTPLVSPTSDDSFSSSVLLGETDAVDHSHKDTPRSVSSDNLSPALSRHAHSHSPLVQSHRFHSVDSSKEDGSGDDSDASRSRKSRQDSDCDCVGGRVKSLAESLRSPSNGFPVPKSPVLRQVNDGGGKGRSPPPPLAPKPRPWSVAGSDRKSGDLCTLLSDGSSPNTSAANTPDSGDALDDGDTASIGSASSDKRSVRELAASLNKQSSLVDKKPEPSSHAKPRPVYNPNPSQNKVTWKVQDEEGRQKMLAAAIAQHFHIEDSVDV